MNIGSALRSVPDIELLLNEPLSRHTTFRVGGPVQCMARPGTEGALCLLLDELRAGDIPFFILGGGSNVVPPDRPWDVAVIQLRKACNRFLRFTGNAGDELLIYAGAGKKLHQLVRHCIQNELAGLEALSGIPGTVGGALVMNAGIPSASISDCLLWVELIDSAGRKQRLARSDLSPGYRTMGLPPGSVLLGGCFELTKAPAAGLRASAAEIMEHRRRTQPLRYPSAGSVFKNPPGGFAGALIEKAGLKGCRIGDAEVSRKHANWIINRGNARASHIVALIEKIENEIFGTFGVRLEREIRILAQP
ncbi:MAG: UDP-N-acetylmuramate dehydrogenase [Syntrophobacteraceae bacterium]